MKEKEYYLKIIHILAKNVIHLSHDDTVDLIEAMLCGDRDNYLNRQEIDEITNKIKESRLPADYLRHIIDRSRAYIESKSKQKDKENNLEYLRKGWKEIDRIFNKNGSEL